MSFESYSQAGQDRFVYEILDHKTDGWFLDVGCGHPIEYNNTYGLERIGWRGFLCDLHHYHEDPECSRILRRAQFFKCDGGELGDHIPMGQGHLAEGRFGVPYDYLSLDVDADSPRVLEALLNHGIGLATVITVEHDWYVGGRERRAEERDLLLGHGYDLVCADVSWGQGPFEDWWAHPAYVPQNRRDLFRCRGRWWRDIPHIMDSL